MTTYVIISVILFIALFLGLFLRIVRENEMGVIVTLGWPSKVGIGSGPKLVFWPIQKIIKFPTTQQSIQFAVPTIMTKRGRVEGYSDTIEPAEISILFTLYYNFKKENLLKTVTKAPGSSEAALAQELIPYATDIIRTIVGRIPWRLVNEERYKFSQLVLSRMFPVLRPEKVWRLDHPACTDNKDICTFSFKECTDNPITAEDLKKSPYVQFGLDKVSLAVEDINFTDPELQKAISAPEKARLEANAKKIAAVGEKIKRSEEGMGDAEARKAMIKVIKKEKDLEVLLTLREVAQGTSNTILYQLPRMFESRVAELLGGSTPGEMTKLLSEDSKKFLAQYIQEAIENLKKTSGGS